MVEISRRQFLGSVASATAGASSAVGLADVAWADVAAPAAPQVQSRADASIAVTWPVAQGENEKYDLRVSGGPQGTREILDVAPGVTITGLTPNSGYSVELRKKVGADVSTWSAALATGTRPPTPEPPQQGFQEMNRSGLFVTVAWDLSTPLSSVPGASELKVAVGSASGGGQPTPTAVGALPTTGSAVLPLVANTTYHVRVVGTASWADPNESQWSGGLIPVDLSFGGLEVPGGASERRLNVHILTRYYG